MSLLLDALNKADQERKRNEATPGINSNHEHVVDHGARNHSILLIAAIIIGLAILLAAIYWLGQRSTAPVPAATIPPATNTASSAPKPKKTILVNKPAEAAQTENANDPSASEETVASLYQNTQTPAAPEQPTPEQAPAVVPDIAVPTSITQFANLPEIHDLPHNILETIPSLGYTEHNYSANGGSVKINGEIKHVNDQLPSGIVIDKILEDGMILHIDKYSFKMRAMNSWVNM